MKVISSCLLLLASLVAAASAVAAGAEYDAAIGRTGTGRCHMDVCEFFIIQAATPIAELKDGTLFALSKLSWEADYKPAGSNEYDRPPIRSGEKTPDAYVVYCSKRRPHIFFHQADGSWEAAPIVSGGSPSGAEEYAYALYWASCHHYLGKNDPGDRLLARLGYRFKSEPGEEPADDPVKTPADLLKELGRH